MVVVAVRGAEVMGELLEAPRQQGLVVVIHVVFVVLALGGDEEEIWMTN